jgi:hypothetical protein
MYTLHEPIAYLKCSILISVLFLKIKPRLKRASHCLSVHPSVCLPIRLHLSICLCAPFNFLGLWCLWDHLAVCVPVCPSPNIFVSCAICVVSKRIRQSVLPRTPCYLYESFSGTVYVLWFYDLFHILHSFSFNNFVSMECNVRMSRIFCSPICPDWFWGQWVAGTLSPGGKRPGREADHSPPTSAEVNIT